MAIKFEVEDKEKQLSKENKKSLKIKKSKKSKLEILLMVLAIIATLFMIVYIALPIAAAFVGAFCYLIVVFVVLLIGACTLFLIFLSPDVRNGVSKYFNICNKIMQGGTEAQEAMTSAFPIAAPICVAITAISLIYSIIVFKKNDDSTLKGSYKAKMIANIVITSICVIFIIVDLIVYFAKR